MMKRPLFTGFLGLALLGGIACGERKPVSNQVEGIENGGVGSLSAMPEFFPHPEKWIESHGATALQVGKEVCLKCHPAEKTSDGNNLPACRSCHLFPHDNEWVDPQVHGVWILKEGKGECVRCHEKEGAVVTCQGCHSIYPHSIDPPWKLPSVHGAVAKGVGKLSCKGCHGDNFSGGFSKVACSKCHDYPHRFQWAKPENHGKKFLEKGASCTTECHGADLKGGLSGVDCASCHQHPEGWQTFERHGLHVSQILQGKTERCEGCHGKGEADGPLAKSCFSCHDGFPHSQSEDWLVEHGPKAYGPAKFTTSQKLGCDASHCHGPDFRGTPQAPSCSNSSCHEDFPHRDLNAWRTLVPSKPAVSRGETFHGDRFIRQWKRGKTDACTKCHELKRGPDVPETVTACFSCHTRKITHLPSGSGGWNTGLGHGKYFSGEGFRAIDNSLNCWKCHGSPVPFASDQTKASLSAESDCYQCHWSYPHSAWEESIWEPVNTAVCGIRNHDHYVTHLFYLMRSPLLTTAGGERVELDDPAAVDAITNTCGRGTAGSCHFEGLRAYNLRNPFPGCVYCHGSGFDIPELPDCEPPPANLQVEGPPRVVSGTPANGSTEVLVRTAVTLRFNEAMRRETVTAPNVFSLKDAGGNLISGDIACSADWCRTLTFTPHTALLYSSAYTIRLSSEAKDWSGAGLASPFVSTFTTMAPDVTPPTVLSFSVTPNSTAASVRTNISVDFSEPMDLNSITTTNAIVVTWFSGPRSVLKRITCAPEGCQKIIVDPVDALRESTRYRVIVSTNARDLSGNRLQRTASFDFVTEIYDEWSGGEGGS